MLTATEGLAPVADRVLGFSVAARDVRGRLVRLDASLNAILAAHAYPPAQAKLLAEALVVTALLGATLRDGEGGLTLQAQSKGPVDLLVCDWRAGELRGYVRARDGAEVPANADLATMFGKGYLAITLDQTLVAERYQGIVPLEGASIAQAVETYFRQSEQLPTLVQVAVDGDAARGWSAGGLLLQYLPQSEEGKARLFAQDEGAPEPPDWRHMRLLAETVTPAELTDPSLSLETLLWRLFHEEQVRLQPGPTPSRGCRCSTAHFRQVLSRFSEYERAEMRGPDGLIGVDCQFCSRVFAVDA
jgi:molecular chaperone Hsp33